MISEQDFERLSAYLDNELSPAEKSALEARLLREPELKRALNDLRLQVRAMRDLPRLKPPRNFTLSSKQAAAIRPARPASFLASLFPALRLATAFSTLMFVVVLAFSLAQGSALQTATGPAAAPQAMEMEKTVEDGTGEVALSAPALSTEDALRALGTPAADVVTRSGVPESDQQTPTPDTFSIAGAATPGATPTAEALTATASLAQRQAETAPPAEATNQLFLPGVSNEPSSEPPASELPWGAFALGLGVLSAVLALLTWLARRR